MILVQKDLQLKSNNFKNKIDDSLKKFFFSKNFDKVFQRNSPFLIGCVFKQKLPTKVQLKVKDIEQKTGFKIYLSFFIPSSLKTKRFKIRLCAITEGASTPT